MFFSKNQLTLLIWFWLKIIVCDNNNLVTYGSSIILVHNKSKARLSSSKLVWSSSSNDQVATCNPNEAFSADNIWTVKYPYFDPDTLEALPIIKDVPAPKKDTDTNRKIKAGLPVKCGDIIQLEHVEYKKYLHGSVNPSFITEMNYQVSAVDQNDVQSKDCNFMILCSNQTKDKYWKIGSLINLIHVSTNMPLVTISNLKYTENNCRGCQIVGHQEVALYKKKHLPSEAQWKAETFLLIESIDTDEDPIITSNNKGDFDHHVHNSIHDEL